MNLYATKTKNIPLKICGAIFDIFSIPLLVIFCLLVRVVRGSRFDSNVKIFMGTMHTNNWVYVAKALRLYSYKVDLVVWCPPEHEVGVIPYDIIISGKFRVIFKSYILRYIFQFLFFLWAVFKYDLFIMCFIGKLLDRSIIARWLELPLLKLAGKKVILNTYGSDVMTPRLTLGNRYKYSAVAGYLEDPYYASLDEAKIASNRKYCQKWADVIISAIDHVEYLKRVDEYLHMRCIDIDELKPHYETDNSVARIVHAPNHPKLKGTEFLKRAIDNLKKQGFNIELKILQGIPHERVLKIIKDSDIVADQFLIGAYSRFAIEGMALGKPVICYLRENLFDKNRIWQECPIVNANPDNLEEQLKSLIVNKDLRIKLGKDSRLYIEHYHSIRYIGRCVDNIIKRRILTRA